MESMSPELISAITGPFSALVLALLAKWIPVIVEAHMQRFDKLIDSHDDDRKLYQNSIQRLSDRQDQMSLDIKVIRDAVTK
jgi:hypothetical protein